MTKMTLKSLPNLWGALVLAAYFALGTPLPQRLKERIAQLAGPQGPARIFAALHMGLGLVMAVALLMPLLIAPDADYPLRSRYTTLFEALGRSRNAPVVQAMYQLVHAAGPAVGYAAIAGMILAAGVLLGWAGMAFGRLKDRMYHELGPVKYAIVIGLLLMMFGVLGKIMLRLLFGIKYLFSLPTFNFNI